MNYVELEAARDELIPSQSEQALIERAVNCVLEIESLPFDVLVSVLFVDKEEIRAINLEQRGMDKPTDVLSFPGLDFDEHYQLTAQPGTEDYDLDYHAVWLGDIVICMEIAAEQAMEYGHAKERELAYLTTHSMYHLLGYDHEIPELQQDMRKKEEAALTRILFEAGGRA